MPHPEARVPRGFCRAGPGSSSLLSFPALLSSKEAPVGGAVLRELTMCSLALPDIAGGRVTLNSTPCVATVSLQQPPAPSSAVDDRRQRPHSSLARPLAVGAGLGFTIAIGLEILRVTIGSNLHV